MNVMDIRGPVNYPVGNGKEYCVIPQALSVPVANRASKNGISKYHIENHGEHNSEDL